MTSSDLFDGDWIDCWHCAGDGKVGHCFEDTCVCFGDPDDPDTCCAPRRCDVCNGKGGWEYDAKSNVECAP